MRSDGMKAFWLAFWVTAAALAPLIGYTLLAGEWQPVPAASSKSDVPIAQPGEANRLTVLAAVADDPQAFVLLYLDAPGNVVQLAAVPAESAVKNGESILTLAECYRAAGPARAAALLGQTLDITVDRYLAATPETWAGLVGGMGTVRVGLSGALTTEQLAQTGMGGEVREWTAAAAHGYLNRLDTAQNVAVTPAAAAAARAVMWQAWLRQKAEQLPAAVPAGLRSASGSLLTNLTATDLMNLQQTLAFLADGKADVRGGTLPGSWNAAASRYEFSDDTLAFLQGFFGINDAQAAPAADGAAQTAAPDNG